MRFSLMFCIFVLFGGYVGANAQTPLPAKPAGAASPPAPTLSAEAFAAPPFLEDPALSPTGDHFAARIAVQGRQLLIMQSLYDKTESPRVFGIGDGKTSVDWWRWVNDDWLLVGVSATSNVYGDDLRLSRVVSLSRKTGEIRKIAWTAAGQNAAKVIWVARDGSPRILLGVQRSVFMGDDFWPDVVEVDVSTGKQRTVVKSRANVMYYYADNAGNVRMGYGYNDETRTARILYRPDGKSAFKEIDRADFRKDEKIHFPRLFLAEPGRAVAIEDDEDGFSSLYELDLATMTRGKKIFGAKGYDIDDIVETASGDGVAGVMITEDRPRVHWLDPMFAQMQAGIDKVIGAGNARVVSWNADRTRVLFHVGGPDQAGAIFLYVKGIMKRLGFVDETLKMAKLSPVSTITYPARDGIDIKGVLTLPKDRPAQHLPLILLPHGGPEARDSEQYDWWVQFLAWRGFAVFQPNYRGSTGFGTKFQKLGDGEWGLKMQDDLNDAVVQLAAKGIVDAKRVCIVGASYGGYATLRAAQRDGALYRCAVSYAGVSDLIGMRKYDSQFLNGRRQSDAWNESAPDIKDVSPLRHAASFSTPVLLLHGKEDLRVPVAQSRQMAEALKKAGKNYRYVEQPLGDHHFSRKEDRLQFLQELDSFLSVHNPAD